MASGHEENETSSTLDQSQLESIDKRKLFVGGLSLDTDEEDLKAHFGQYGEIMHCVVKREPMTGRSRCFGFLTYLQSSAMKKVQEIRDHVIKGRRVDPKPAEPRVNDEAILKVFIGGLDSNMSEEDLKAYFEKHGRVVNIEWPKDRMRGGQKKNFAFVEFDDEKVVNDVVRQAKQEIGGRLCDVRKAIPSSQKQMQDQQHGRGNWQDGGFGGGAGGYGYGFDPYAAAAAAYGYGADFYGYGQAGFDPNSFFDPSTMAAYYGYDMSAMAGYGDMSAMGGYGGYGDMGAGGGSRDFRSGGRGPMRGSGGDSGYGSRGSSAGGRGGSSGTGRSNPGYHPYKR